MKTVGLLILLALPVAAAPLPAQRGSARAAAVSLLEPEEQLMRVRYDVRGKGSATVVLLNGDTLDVAVWDRQVAALMPHFRVVRYDRGSRASLAGDDGPSSADDLYDLLGVLDVDRVHLVATGEGSAVAAEFAAKHPRMVDRVVLANPPDVATDGRTTGAKCPSERACVEVASTVGGAVASDLVCAATNATLMVGDLDAARIPFARRVLVITGDEPSLAVDARLAWPGVEHATSVTVPGVSGLVNVEAPLVFNGAVLRFLLQP